MCHHLGCPLAERVLDAREEQSRDAGEVVCLYVESWEKNHLKHFKQLV